MGSERPRERGSGGAFRRGGVAVVGVVAVGLFVEDLVDGGPCGRFVDEGCAGGVGGDQALQAQVVDGAGVAAAGGVDQGGGVVGEQGVGSPGEGQVVLDVAGGLGGGHAGHGVTEGE